MGSSHSSFDASVRLRRQLFAGVIALGLVAVTGVILWWPTGEAPALYGEDGAPDFVDATVTEARPGDCPGLEFEDVTMPCQQITARVTTGPNTGDLAEVSIYITEQSVPTLEVDQKIVLRSFQAPGQDAQYSFGELQRSPQLWLLIAAFALVVVLFGRWHGLRALLGLGASLWLLVAFLIPSLLRGNPPVGVAIAGGFVIAGVAVYVAHGARITTTVAFLGTVTSVVVIAVLAALAVSFANLTGLDEGAAGTLSLSADTIDLRGLLIAGIVVGALGVLDDVTVTQVAAVVELRKANPELRGFELYRSAIRIGRDHVAAVVNTLVLAYAGASLPLLLFFAQSDTPFARVATSQIVAVEIVRTVVGSIGLVLSVPVTTALAAAVLVVGDDDNDNDNDNDNEGHPDATELPGHGSTQARWENFSPREDDGGFG